MFLVHRMAVTLATWTSEPPGTAVRLRWSVQAIVSVEDVNQSACHGDVGVSWPARFSRT